MKMVRHHFGFWFSLNGNLFYSLSLSPSDNLLFIASKWILFRLRTACAIIVCGAVHFRGNSADMHNCPFNHCMVGITSELQHYRQANRAKETTKKRRSSLQTQRSVNVFLPKMGAEQARPSFVLVHRGISTAQKKRGRYEYERGEFFELVRRAHDRIHARTKKRSGAFFLSG